MGHRTLLTNGSIFYYFYTITYEGKKTINILWTSALKKNIHIWYFLYRYIFFFMTLWWAAVHGVAKSRTRLNNFTFTFHFHALEKEMVAHSGVLAWRIPGTGEPGGLPSMGSHRVGHNWSDLAVSNIYFSLKMLYVYTCVYIICTYIHLLIHLPSIYLSR